MKVKKADYSTGALLYIRTNFLGPPVRAKNLIQLYSYINYHRTAINLSDIVCCMSGGVWSMSDGVNVYRLK